MSRTSFHRSSMDQNLFIKSGRILVVMMRRLPTFREFVAAGPKWNFCRRATLVVPETAGDCVSQQPSVRIDIILQTLRHWVVLQGPLAFCITDPGGEREREREGSDATRFHNCTHETADSPAPSCAPKWEMKNGNKLQRD